MIQRKIVLLMSVLAVAASLPALAQEAPPPHRQPRIGVSRQMLAARQAAPPHDVAGTATVIDSQTLRVEDVEIRLFGIVPPQLSANFGVQARAAMDSLTASGPLRCHIRDRDRDGHYLASCFNNNSLDPAVELLKHGLAVAARGSLEGTEFETSYIAAEQAAQVQHLGLWSLSTAAASAPAQAAPVAAAPAPVPVPRVEMPAPKPEPVAQIPAAPKIEKPVVVPAPAAVAAAAHDDGANFFARYQLLLTGFVMLFTALGVTGILFAQRRIERREELRALAAALRGELMAARALCHGRLKGILTETDDRMMSWPRIRSTLYQAYVGRIGWLGAELARQIASLYGQSNDYAAYYHAGEDPRADNMPKRHALQTMVQHIEEVLPKLALVEETGKRPSARPLTALAPARSVPAAPIPLESTPVPVPSLAAPRVTTTYVSQQPQQTQQAPVSETPKSRTEDKPVAEKPAAPKVEKTEKPADSASEPAAKTEDKPVAEKAAVEKAVAEKAATEKTVSEKPAAPKASEASAQSEASKDGDPLREAIANLTRSHAAAASQIVSQATTQAIKPESAKAEMPKVEAAEKKPAPAEATKQPAAQPAAASQASASHATTAPKSPVDAVVATAAAAAPLWDAVRKFAREHLPEKRALAEDEALPDYAALIEADMSSFTFGEADYEFDDENEPVKRSRNGHG